MNGKRDHLDGSRPPAPLDFVASMAASTWGSLHSDRLETLDGDLAFDGVRIDKLEHATYRRALSIAQERHQAFNWLLGFQSLYSDVATDT